MSLNDRLRIVVNEFFHGLRVVANGLKDNLLTKFMLKDR